MAKQQFEFREGFRIGIDANIVGNELEKIRRENHGVLKPSYVIDSARAKSSLLHDYFEWDNDLAGEKYREEQARNLIRHVIIITPQVKSNHVRAYVSIQGRDNGKAYHAIADIMNDDEYREKLLANALIDLDAWKQKYETFKELSDIFSAIDRTKTRINKPKMTLRKAA